MPVLWFAMGLLFGFLFGGCGHQKIVPSINKKDNQQLAMIVVWTAYSDYEQSPPQVGHYPPTIAWIDGSSFMVGNQYVRGAYYDRPNLALVAWPVGNHLFSNTAFAHELCHAFFHDDNSHSVCINYLPPIETANKRLKDLGL